MSIKIYLSKRYLQERQRNGRQKYRWVLRWQDPTTGEWKYESTGTADKTRAKYLQDAKWDEVNRPAQASRELALPLEPEPDLEKKSRPTWDECRKAIKRAMAADKLRPSTIALALLIFDTLRRTFPDYVSPADITPTLANEFKRRRAEEVRGLSAWTIKGNIAALRAIFGKWLGRECGLLDPAANPFSSVKPPKCDEPDVRIVTLEERTELYAWLGRRWHNWQLPLIYLDVADATGWRATEIASMKADDILADGFVRVAAESCKTRRHKHSCISPTLHAELQACAADGWAFGRFADELRRLLYVARRQPHHAAKIKEFSPKRLVGWIQDELKRFNDAKAKAAKKADPPQTWEPFTLHDFRRTAITALQMSGTSEKETSVLVGATPEVIRKHYEKMDQQGIARRALARRLAVEGPETARGQAHRSLRRLRAARNRHG